MQFSGKTVIVTGGGRDIGRACVMRFAKEGANVAINYHSSSAGAESAVEEIKKAGGNAFALQGDMASEQGVAELVAKTRESFGDSIHALAHVTGGLVARTRIQDMETEHWHKVMDLNTTSLFFMARASIPHMPAGSSIVAIASQAGRDGGGPGAVAYAASKGAVMTMTRGLAKELGPDIRVNAICPGMINTDFHNVFTADEVREKVAAATPLKREGNSEEVANLVFFAASEQSSFMTGNCIDINGGLLFS